MKRFAAHIGLTSFFALAVAFYLPEIAVAVMMIAAAVLTLVFLLIKKTRKAIRLPLMAGVIAISCAVNLVYGAIAVKPIVNRYCGDDKRIEATLTDEEYRLYGKYYYRLRTDSVDSERVRVKLLLKSNKPLDLEPYDTLSFTADVSETDNKYYRAKGYPITVNEVSVDYTGEKSGSRPLYYQVIRIRRAMRGALERHLPNDEASLCKAILIGDKYALDPAIKEDFRRSGATYFVVVSGMHFAVFCAICFRVFKKLFRKWFFYYPALVAVVILYMMITGFQPSVVRSGVMMLIYYTGRIGFRQTDSLTSLGVAGLCMPLIFSPYGCGDTGMILSFAATFGIIVWHTPIYERVCISKYPKSAILRSIVNGVNAVISLLCVSIAANILVLPLSVLIFNGFSAATLISALLYPFIWCILVLSIGVCSLFYLGPLRFLSLLLSWPLYYLSKIVLWMVRTIASFPYAFIHVKSVYFYVWMGLTLILGLIAYCLRERRRITACAVMLSAILFLSGIVCSCIVQLNTNRLEIYGSKTGMTVYLNCRGRIHMLRFDCNSVSAYRMLKQLQSDSGGAESAVCTRYHERVNYNRMSDKEFPIEHYLMYKNARGLIYFGDPDEVFEGDSEFILDDGVTLRTVEYGKRVLLYLIDGDVSVMLIPNSFPLSAIPQSMRAADIILIDKAVKGYETLSCDTLILCSEHKPENDPYLPQYRTMYEKDDAHLSFDLSAN